MLKGTGGGVARRYDVHNIAQESARIREQLERITQNIGGLRDDLAVRHEDKHEET